MSAADEIKQKLRKRVAVKPGLAAKALGVGRHLLLRAIEEGHVPVNGVGNVPADWLLSAMEISNRNGGKAA
jgi:hypothetical protein